MIAPLIHVIHSLITIPIIPALLPVWFGENPSVILSKDEKNHDTEASDNHKAVAISPTAKGAILPYDVLRCSFELLKVTLAYYLPGDIDPDDQSVRSRAAQDSPGNTIDDICPPLFVLLSRLCVADPTSRARLRHWLVPENLDRSTPLESRKNALGRSLRLLGSVYHPRTKSAAGEMLFSMADCNGMD